MGEERRHELGAHADLTLEIVAGIEHWEQGEIVLTLRGDGHAEVLNRRGGRQQRFTGRVEAPAVDGLASALAGLVLPGRASATEPDEVPVKVVLRRDGETLSSGEAWHSHRYEDRRLDDVLRRFEAIVESVTSGRLPYGDAGPLE